MPSVLQCIWSIGSCEGALRKGEMRCRANEVAPLGKGEYSVDADSATQMLTHIPPLCFFLGGAGGQVRVDVACFRWLANGCVKLLVLSYTYVDAYVHRHE